MAHSSDELLAALHNLHHSIAAEAAGRFERWDRDIERPSFATSAANLARYLALRHHDLCAMQHGLMRHGMSSLGRLESCVLLAQHTVEGALDAMVSGRPVGPGWPPSEEDFFRGEAKLLASTHAPLGGAADQDAGRILVTLATEAADDPGYMLEIARRGAYAVRVNCAHDDAHSWAAMIENTRKAGDAVGRRISVVMDIAGPKFRIGVVGRQPGRCIVAGDQLRPFADAAAFAVDDMIEAVSE